MQLTYSLPFVRALVHLHPLTTLFPFQKQVSTRLSRQKKRSVLLAWVKDLRQKTKLLGLTPLNDPRLVLLPPALALVSFQCVSFLKGSSWLSDAAHFVALW